MITNLTKPNSEHKIKPSTEWWLLSFSRGVLVNLESSAMLARAHVGGSGGDVLINHLWLWVCQGWWTAAKWAHGYLQQKHVYVWQVHTLVWMYVLHRHAAKKRHEWRTGRETRTGKSSCGALNNNYKISMNITISKNFTLSAIYKHGPVTF